MTRFAPAPTTTWRAGHHQALAASLARVRAKKPERGGAALIGESEAMTGLRTVIRRIGATPCNVLIEGETGTGKDIVARLLHEASPRAAQPFVTINCSAVPDTLFESELFGYERGAFTGAHAASAGRLQAGNGGTIFLDEVGELGMPLQPKLLRAIDQREVQRLGSRRHETIDVRWVAATNRDLQQSVRSGFFRADLFYRLNVYSLVIPPLRERPEDILILARAFLAEIGPTYACGAAAFTDEALMRLVAYEWPGNVRQLRNVWRAACSTPRRMKSGRRRCRRRCVAPTSPCRRPPRSSGCAWSRRCARPAATSRKQLSACTGRA